ncbi:ribonuclease J [Halobacteriovorax sp. JY17]|uniref:ribonuclease J n=1 Tax=Halobacteriovorax sp. JY17 TaxID=2014617 RepID=UPI000C4ECFF1|nr:ribonuclease J [Halobacteriovorax sp. JY17]PIK14426.1 MAG: hypothetical protein CES88_08775 [Halobacteriovorax sp. JY17]
MSKSILEIQPVGGVGQIGSNMTRFIGENTNIIVDAGILFPSEDFFDINYLIPDLSELAQDPPTDLVITHGHEDHIGAIIHVIDRFPDITIHAPRFAALLIRKKLDYAKMSKKIFEYQSESILEFRDFNIYPIHVNHSIPDTFGLLIKDKKNRQCTLMVSDFKVDSQSPYEREFDFKKLINLSKDCLTRIILADSTNIISTNLNTPSEGMILPNFKKIFKEDYDNIYLTCFSSNVHRVMSVIEAAKESGRRVLLYGRSMISYAQSAVERGLMIDSDFYTDQASLPNKKKLVVLLSGCQGDFRGTFRRVAKGEDTHFKPTAKDLFVLSSKSIPGNEKKISLLENEITEKGIDIISARDELIHVSGHPGRNDLLTVYNHFQPDYIVPIHGESLFIKKHIEFIKKEFPKAHPIQLSNFDQLSISSKLEVTLKECSPLQPILIHGKGIEIERENISRRRKLATTGSIFISIKTDSLLKRKVQFEYSFDGLPNSFNSNREDFNTLLSNELVGRKIKLLEKTADEIRIAVRRYAQNLLGYKPITIVHFV